MDINATKMPFGSDGLAIEQELVGSDYEMVPGGSALNFNRLCAQLGLATVIVGKVGADGPGQLLERMIKEAGIYPALVTDSGAATNIGMNFVNSAGQALMVSAGSANQALSAEEVLERAEPLLPEVEYLYLGTCLKLKRLLPAYERLAERAKACNAKIVVDHGRHNSATTEQDRAMVRDLVKHADYYFPSRGEFLEMWGVDSIQDGLLGRDWGNTRVVVKDAGNGAHALIDGRVVRVPAYEVKPLNTVGAGDSFNAGVITAIRSGHDLSSAVRFGCATAALKISRRTLPTLADVKSLEAA